MEGQKHFIFNKIGHIHQHAPIPPSHRYHLIMGHVNPLQPLHASPNCLLAFAATNQHLQGTNGTRHLQQEDKNSNITKTETIKNMKAKKQISKQGKPPTRANMNTVKERTSRKTTICTAKTRNQVLDSHFAYINLLELQINSQLEKYSYLYMIFISFLHISARC